MQQSESLVSLHSGYDDVTGAEVLMTRIGIATAIPIGAEVQNDTIKCLYISPFGIYLLLKFNFQCYLFMKKSGVGSAEEKRSKQNEKCYEKNWFTHFVTLPVCVWGHVTPNTLPTEYAGY